MTANGDIDLDLRVLDFDGTVDDAMKDAIEDVTPKEAGTP